ncbi:MAG: GyrI-like domain-containing protein [Anaerolineae bacterium]|nr:GyrI-like domain-containing protein [Anaerolineae bacterium]
MVNYRIIERPAFDVIGKKGWIAEQDDFERFWEQCRADGLLAIFEALNGWQRGAQTNGTTLGISRVEKDPTNRDFYYMIAIEAPPDCSNADLEHYQVPASQWAVFECHGKVPQSIVQAEMFAFMEWLPTSGYVHAFAPEMEVYYPGESSDDYYCEFWLPIIRKAL